MRFRIAFILLILSLSTTLDASYRFSVWMQRTTTSRERLRQHAGIINESNPTFYRMTGTQGALYESSTARDALYLSALTGTEVLPTFQNINDTGWQGTATANYVIHPSYRDAYTTEIANTVINRGWAGADIDYEEVPAASKDDFTAFIALLASKLHAANKKLSVCVYAKRNDNISTSWPYPAGQDYTALAQHADFIKIMAYGRHSTPKANSQFTFINDVLNYAKSKITDHKKIILGIPWYAQEYVDDNSDGTYDRYLSYGYDQVQSFLQANPTITPTRDPLSGEMNFQYTDANGATHWVWYTDGATYGGKLQYVLQNHPTIGGFAHWAIGLEEPGVFGVIPQLKPRWEFNKDSQHDVILRDSTLGDVRLWNISNGAIALQTTVGTDALFEVHAAGHFTRDGETDLILRNPTSGDVKLWQMNNHTVASTSILPNANPVWKIVAAADLNGDGRHEIIWHNQSTGEMAYWQRSLTDGGWSGAYFAWAMSPANWKLAGAADFNLDGRDDLLWRNDSSGENVLWTMNGGTVTNSNAILTAYSPWKITGIGDFNHDLHPDILWQHDSNLQNVIWFMKDRTYLGGGNIVTSEPGWKVVRVGDFNGDDYADILWRHNTTGNVVVWKMNGLTYIGGGDVGQPGSNWSVTAK